MANMSSRPIVIAGAHCESALLSYLYCSILVWAQASDRLGRRVARAGMFFGLALVSAVASLLVSEAYKTGTRSLGFMLTNYGAVGAITIAKFAVQRWAMTTQRSFRGRSVGAQSDGIVPFSTPQKHA